MSRWYEQQAAGEAASIATTNIMMIMAGRISAQTGLAAHHHHGGPHSRRTASTARLPTAAWGIRLGSPSAAGVPVLVLVRAHAAWRTGR